MMRTGPDLYTIGTIPLMLFSVPGDGHLAYSVLFSVPRDGNQGLENAIFHRRRLHRGNRGKCPGTHKGTGAKINFCPGNFQGV